MSITGVDPRVSAGPHPIELVVDTPSGVERETIVLAPGSVVEFYATDGKRYEVRVDETLVGLALVESASGTLTNEELATAEAFALERGIALPAAASARELALTALHVGRLNPVEPDEEPTPKRRFGK